MRWPLLDQSVDQQRQRPQKGKCKNDLDDRASAQGKELYSLGTGLYLCVRPRAGLTAGNTQGVQVGGWYT